MITTVCLKLSVGTKGFVTWMWLMGMMCAVTIDVCLAYIAIQVAF